MKDKFQMSSMGELTFFLGLQVKQKQDGIIISQDNYVAKILRKFGLTNRKSANTPIDTEKPLLKDPDGEDVHVTPKASHLHPVKRIFSDYAGASLDRKSTTRGCQFLGCRLISWQCKKHTVVATTSTEAEYVAATSCCDQVLWIQNQLLDCGGEIAELDADDDITLEEVAAEVTKDADDDEAEPTELKELIELVTTAKLMTKVVTAAATTITATSMPKASAAKRRKGVVIRDPEEIATPSVIVHSESKSKDKGKGIIVEEPKPLKKQAQIEQDEAYARELEAELNANINWNEVIEQVKRKEKQDITVMRYQALKRKPQTEAQARKNMMVYLKNIALEKGEEELEEEASKQSKRKSETSEEKAAKKHKLDEKVKDLKTHLQIVPNDEDVVYPEATPLALKPSLAKLKTYMLRGPIIKVVILTNLKMNTALSSGLGTLPSNTITNPKEDLKVITTRSENAYKGPTIPTTSSPPKVVEHETEVTKDTVPPTNNESTKDVQPSVVQIETPIPNSEPVVPVDEPFVAPVSAPKPSQNLSIPYPSRLHDQKLRDKTNDQKEKIFKIFKDLDFNISFSDALILMPKTPLNEHCSAVLLKKLPEKLGDPSKFLIPCDFQGMDECLALADLGASINLMPLSMWNKISLPELSPTCMTLELADRLISCLVRVTEDVFVKVGTFHFPADFVVVDFDADPRVPLILGRSFLKIEKALIDVYEGELTLRVGKEAVTFNLDQTLRYSTNYDAMSVNQIDLIDVACEEYSQEVLGFSMSGNPTPSTKPIISNSSPTLTPFEDSDFLLEETDAFLAINNEPMSPEFDDSYYDSEGDILLLEKFLNDDPSSPPLPP
uniref:Reverse transcriptase domain-containing protein n=1 Tax=Tanacetum cinerariifolium TaxID=118510 RepID=A0A6L2KMI1_TANCI|nr:reverse transcriptase domain-containing protein [Tanacetum cinerariifolium]